MAWRARLIPADAEWVRITRPGEVQQSQQREAFAEACRRFDATPAGEVCYSSLDKSLGARTQNRDGSTFWLKVHLFRSASLERQQSEDLRLLAAAGLPVPSILDSIDWRADGLHWWAQKFTLAESPIVHEQRLLRHPVTVEDAWLKELKQTLDRLSQIPLPPQRKLSPDFERLIVRYFGRKAPHQANEWRTAHGDLHWANLTAPKLMLLDWEHLCIAPRGFDAAKLLAISVLDPAICRRIEATFADDLNSASGMAARLYQLAMRLRNIEIGDADPRPYRAIEAEAKRLLRL